MSDLVGHFSIYGDFAAADITSALGIEPSNVNPKGTMYEGADFASRVEEWELYCPDGLSMGRQIDFLLDAFWSKSDVLRELTEQYHADFNISGENSEVLELSPEHLRKLAALRIHLNFFLTTTSGQNGASR